MQNSSPLHCRNGWERISARARMIAPWIGPLQVASYGWAPSTPPEGIKTEVVYVHHILSLNENQAQAKQDQRAGSLLSTVKVFTRTNQFLDQQVYRSKRLLKELGALAMLVRGSAVIM